MVTSKLVEFIYKTKFEDLTPAAVKMARLAFLDWLGNAAAGSKQSPAQMVLGVIEELGGHPEATLLAGGGRRSSSVNAALLNGVMSHIVELDDVHRTSIIHPAAAVIPAALAAAEKEHAGGRDLITAIVVGYEVAIRVAEAITPSHYYFWHTTGTCGTFGAAAAAAKILRLGTDAVTWALGSAGTQAAGLWEFMADGGSMSKHLHPGKAAMNGLLSALLARRGFTGASRILEGKRGFCRATATDINFDLITGGLGGGSYKIEEISFKIHSSCRHTHPAVDVVLDLALRHEIGPDDVQSIKVSTYKTALDITNNYMPDSLYAAKFSLPFCVALALKERRCGPAEFNKAALTDPVIRSLMERTKLAVDPALDALHPRLWPVSVKITTRSGRVLEGYSDSTRGDPENPVPAEELEQKFLTLAGGPWGKGNAARIMELCRDLDAVSDMAFVLLF
ncbi:MAG: MmgE/PrpD family protein [Bacillota bacterium]